MDDADAFSGNESLIGDEFGSPVPPTTTEIYPPIGAIGIKVG